MMKQTLVVALVIAASTACVELQAGVVVHEEKRFPTSGDVEVALRTFDGSIRVRSWDRDEVLVDIERRAEDEEMARALPVNAAQQGNRIVVEAEQDRDRRGGIQLRGPSSSVSFTVTVPRTARLDASTGDGSIHVEELRGAVALRTGDGSIQANRLYGGVVAHSGDGSISIRDAHGRVDADSGDGSIDVTGMFEYLRVRSGDGSVRVEAQDGSAMKDDWDATTGDGSISFRVPGAFDADVDAHSGDGRVRVGGVTQGGDSSEQNTFRGRLGKGGRVLRLRSGDGSIVVENAAAGN